MLWYRHWLEMRSPLRLLAIAAALMVSLYPVFVHSAGGFLDETGIVAEEIRDLVPLAGEASLPAVVPWGIAVQFLSLSVILLPLLLRGSGIADARSRRHASELFTLSLPRSRASLVASRLAASCCAAAAFMLVLLATDVVGLLLAGRPAPLLPMALATVRALVLVSAALASLGALSLLLGELWVGFLTMVGMLMALGSYWTPLEHFIAGASWAAAAGTLLIAGALGGLAILAAQRREFS